MPEDYTVAPSFYFSILPDVASGHILGCRCCCQNVVLTPSGHPGPQNSTWDSFLSFSTLNIWIYLFIFSQQSFRDQSVSSMPIWATRYPYQHCSVTPVFSCFSLNRENQKALPKQACSSLALTLIHSTAEVHTPVLWLCPPWNLQTNRAGDCRKEPTAARPALGSPGEVQCKNDLAKSLFF